MGTSIATDDWIEIDSWWDSFVDSHSLVLVDEATQLLDRRWLDELGTGLEPWWSWHEQDQRQLYEALRKLFGGIRDLWRHSSTPLSSDPLAVDWRSRNPIHGPLRANHEEDWSQWLADLLRMSPTLAQTAFNIEPTSQPHRVHREQLLVDPTGMDRFPDILAHFEEIGLHIEVKIGDENYTKTPHTATLIERQYPEYEWRHILLVPKKKRAIVDQEFGDDELGTDELERLQIRVEGSPDIDVRYWEDVGQALRSILVTESEGPDHLIASAFIFCALIEQKILGFVPETGAGTGDINVFSVHGGDIEPQLNYLREFKKDIEHG